MAFFLKAGFVSGLKKNAIFICLAIHIHNTDNAAEHKDWLRCLSSHERMIYDRAYGKAFYPTESDGAGRLAGVLAVLKEKE